MFGQRLTLTLVARRSRHFAGTRFRKRGISHQVGIRGQEVLYVCMFWGVRYQEEGLVWVVGGKPGRALERAMEQHDGVLTADMIVMKCFCYSNEPAHVTFHVSALQLLLHGSMPDMLHRMM